MKVVRMMKHKDPKPCTLMSIDGSSTAIATSIFQQTQDETLLLETSKIRLEKLPMNTKLNIISAYFPLYFKKYKIDYVFIEQPIYIQNPATSRVLSQISGHLMGVCLWGCDNVYEVPIANWKSFIGYKNVSQADKNYWTRQYGEAEAKKIAAKQRKQRTIDIVHSKIPSIKHIIDNDICDSIGIGLYGLDVVNKENFDGA